MLSYKIFRSVEFVNRSAEIERAHNVLKERNRGVINFEGDRGSGKTTLVFELYRRFHERSDLSPFLIGLFPYSAPEFQGESDIWINQERSFAREDIPALLNKLAA